MALGYRGMAQDRPLFPRTPGLYRAWVWHAKWRAAVGGWGGWVGEVGGVHFDQALVKGALCPQRDALALGLLL